jgi:hypothetical protein
MKINHEETKGAKAFSDLSSYRRGWFSEESAAYQLPL